MSDTFWTAFFTATSSLLTVVFGGVITVYLAKIKVQGERAAVQVEAAAVKVEEVAAKTNQAAVQVEAAAVKVDEVKKTLEDTTAATDVKLAGLAKVTAATHVLVNSRMAASLRNTARAMRRVADLTGQSDDAKLATEAEELSKDHEAQQAIVDAQPGTDAEKQGKS